MADSKPLRSMTNLVNSRLEAVKRNKVLLTNVYTLYQGTELVEEMRSQLSPSLSEQLMAKWARFGAKRWDILLEHMDGNPVLINLVWELIVWRNVGNKDVTVHLLREYRKDVKQKCLRHLKHLKISPRGKTEIANYLLLALDEYQFDLSNVAEKLDDIDDCVMEIWENLGKEVDPSRHLPDTENVAEIIQCLLDTLRDISAEILECRSQDESINTERIQELEATIEELKKEQVHAKYIQDAQAREIKNLKIKKGKLENQKKELQEKNAELEIEKQEILTQSEEKGRVVQEMEVKVGRQQVYIDQLYNTSKTVIEENQMLQAEKQELMNYFKNVADDLKYQCKESLSQFKASTANETSQAISRVEEAGKKSTERAVRELNNAQINNGLKIIYHARADSPDHLE